MDNRENLLGILRTLFKWKKQIVATCTIAGIGSVIIVLLLPVYYQATTVFLAASPDQAKPELLFGQGMLEGEYYGTENDIDRILTIAQSNELVNFMIDSFNLYEHYDINPDGPRSSYWVKENFFGLYEVKKTKRDAIQLSLEDKDRVKAAQMANSARERINYILQSLIKNSQMKQLQTYEDDMATKEELLTVLGDSLNSLRQLYGIFNVQSQTETLITQLDNAEAKLVRNRARLGALREIRMAGIADTIKMNEALVKGMKDEVDTLRVKVQKLSAGLGVVGVYEKQFAEANLRLSQTKERAKQLRSTFNSDIPAILLVETAETPVIKSRPQRKLIVLGALVVAFFFAVIGVLLIENYRDVNWREVYHGK